MCSVLKVSRSGYYKWKSITVSPQAERKARVLQRIHYHFKDSHRRYGSPKITDLLRKEGYTLSERTVGKYMRELGLRSCVAKRFRVKTTDSNHDLPIAPNLLNQKFATAEPNKVWVTDITYIPCRQGRLYLASVLDLCTREIVGWRLEELNKYRMKASMSRKGNCYDNACIESFHSILKKEFVYCTKFKTKQQAQDEMFQYIEFFYNRKRIHSALGYLSPVQFAAKFKKKKTA
ncbi:transposase [Paenibacillus sp. P3E]|nr:transposase [Paenibacillus sp. P3E]